MAGAFQAECDRDEAGGEIDNAARNKERRHPARALLVQDDRHFGNAFDAADAGTDQHAGRGLVLVTFRPPAGVVERLFGRAHRVKNKVVDLALLLGLHPLIGIEGAVAAVATRDHAGDFGGYVGDVERIDDFGAALTLEQTLPCRFHTASERRDHPHPGDDDTSHSRLQAKLTLLRSALPGIAPSSATKEAIERPRRLSLSF